MTLKEIQTAHEKGNVLFGIRQVLKAGKKSKKKLNVFVCEDTREETLGRLQEGKVEAEVLKGKKEDVAKELNMDFLCEVFLIK